MTKNTYIDHSGKEISLAFIQIEGLINDLELGILPKEQGRKQRISIDVTVGFPDSMTQISDSEEALLNHGFDSRPVREIILAACVEKTALLETIANAACARILDLDGALTVSIKITKTYLMADTAKTSLTVFRRK